MIATWVQANMHQMVKIYIIFNFLHLALAVSLLLLRNIEKARGYKECDEKVLEAEVKDGSENVKQENDIIVVSCKRLLSSIFVSQVKFIYFLLIFRR